MAIGRTYTHYASPLDAKALTGFRARRYRGTGGPIRHVAPTLTELLRLYVEASTAWGRTDTTNEAERFGAAVLSLGAASAEQQVLAQISAREALLSAAEREIELELWRATRLAAGEAENVRALRRLLDNADTVYNIAMARFTSSVGSILEMLRAQKCVSERQFIGNAGGNHGAGSTNSPESGIGSHAVSKMSVK